MSFYEENIKYDALIKDSKEIFSEGMNPYLHFFFWRLSKYFKSLDRHSKMPSLLIEHLHRIKNKNIKQICPYSIANFDHLIDETENAIILGNYWSIFYCVELLAERTADIIIRENKEMVQDEYEKIKNKLKEGKLSLELKIKLLNIIFSEIKNSDLKIFIAFLTLLQRIRNKFMFHINNYDDYSFVLDDGEKEELLRKLVSTIKEETDKVSKLLVDDASSKKILDTYSASFQNLIDLFREMKPKEGTTVCNMIIYDDLPLFFAEISYGFILFFGKENFSFNKEETVSNEKFIKLLKEMIKEQEELSKKGNN
jgi:hypothetical protein